jgi:hypothetical protein
MTIDEPGISELEKTLPTAPQICLREEELPVINSVQEALAQKMDIQSIYELTGVKIREKFNARVIDIVTYDKNANLI